ncbi:MAG: cupin domain-containing protein [Oscillochloris sp.]|nr:cupin domain-containing protein [Oscillochloris sp.]
MENSPTCRVVRDDDSYEGKQGLTYMAGISAERVGAQAICMHLLRLPPGARAKAHLHQSHETAIYVLSGRAGMWFGENLAEHLVVQAGEYLYIPAGVPHLPYNPGPTEAVAVLARTDPNEQESVLLRPDLDAIHGPDEVGPGM